MLKRRNALRYESLERREMMAGDVTAFVSNGDLFLEEATGHVGGDTGVFVSQLPDGKLRIAGNWAPDGTQSLVNGQTHQDFTVTGSLFVNFGSGQDIVTFLGGPDTPTFDEVHIDVGAVTATGTADDDVVMIWGAVTRGTMEIETGAGDDWVYITDAGIGDPMHPADLIIRTGSGVDGVDVEALRSVVYGKLEIQTFASLKESEADRVHVSDATMTSDLIVRTGGGNDDIWLNIANAYDDIEIDAGAGHDDVKLEYVNALDDLMARMGDGFDELELNNVSAVDASFLGEAGHDDIRKTGKNTFNSKVETGWEYVNGRLKFDFRREDFEIVHQLKRPIFNIGG
jgi:hypothetical protein